MSFDSNFVRIPHRVLLHPSVWRATDPGRTLNSHTYETFNGWEDWGVLTHGVSYMNDTEDFDVDQVAYDIVSVPWRKVIRFNGLTSRVRALHRDELPMAVAIVRQRGHDLFTMLGVLERFADPNALSYRAGDYTDHPEFVLGERPPWMPMLWEGED